jgi:hypothetical protein
MKQLSTGLPGRLKSRSTPFQYAQWSSAREVNSVLLSSIRLLSSLETEEEAQVIAEVEVVIVHPDGMLLQGNPAQLLAETRNPVQATPRSRRLPPRCRAAPPRRSGSRLRVRRRGTSPWPGSPRSGRSVARSHTVPFVLHPDAGSLAPEVSTGGSTSSRCSRSCDHERSVPAARCRTNPLADDAERLARRRGAGRQALVVRLQVEQLREALCLWSWSPILSGLAPGLWTRTEPPRVFQRL